MTLNRKSQGQGQRERSQFRRSHQGLFPCKVSSLYWLMLPRTNLNAEVNQNVDRQTDGQTDGHHQSISQNCFAIRPTKSKASRSKLWYHVKAIFTRNLYENPDLFGVWKLKPRLNIFKNRSNIKVKVRRSKHYGTTWKVLSQGIHMGNMKNTIYSNLKVNAKVKVYYHIPTWTRIPTQTLGLWH